MEEELSMKEQNYKKPVDREQLEKEYETLGIRDRFIFSKVMTDKNLCMNIPHLGFHQSAL